MSHNAIFSKKKKKKKKKDIGKTHLLAIFLYWQMWWPFVHNVYDPGQLNRVIVPVPAFHGAKKKKKKKTVPPWGGRWLHSYRNSAESEGGAGMKREASTGRTGIPIRNHQHEIDPN